MSDTYITMPVIVHELVDGPVPEDELEEPEALDRRSCLYRIRVPPDQLNPLVPAPRARSRSSEVPTKRIRDEALRSSDSISALIVTLRAMLVPSLASARCTRGPGLSACQHACVLITGLHCFAPH